MIIVVFSYLNDSMSALLKAEGFSLPYFFILSLKVWREHYIGGKKAHLEHGLTAGLKIKVSVLDASSEPR